MSITVYYQKCVDPTLCDIARDRVKTKFRKNKLLALSRNCYIISQNFAVEYREKIAQNFA
jgi:hypothetical protein